MNSLGTGSSNVLTTSGGSGSQSNTNGGGFDALNLQVSSGKAGSGKGGAKQNYFQGKDGSIISIIKLYSTDGKTKIDANRIVDNIASNQGNNVVVSSNLSGQQEIIQGNNV